MKILLVSSAFYPENSPRSFRATELAKQFSKDGHTVKLLTIDRNFDYTKTANDFGIEIETIGKRKFQNFLPGNSLIKRAIKKALNLLFEFPDIEIFFLVRRALKKERNHDLMISFAVPYPTHWGCASVFKKHVQADYWIADCGDPYMGVWIKQIKKLFYFKYVEKWMFKKVDKIAITKESFKVNYYPEFHHKITEITQGFNFDNIQLANYTKNQIPTFAFAGTVGLVMRNPEKFLTYLLTIKRDFLFIVYSRNKEIFEPYISKFNGKLVVKNYVPREELLFELSKMDFLVNFEFNPTEQSPSKLIDYAITKRPILSSNYNDFDGSIIDQFFNENYSESFVIDEIDKFRIENVAKKFITVAQSI